MYISGSMRVAFVTLLLLAFMSAQTETQPTALSIGSAKVSDLKGEVSFRSPQGTEITPQRGITLAPDSRIETTKGSVLLELLDGSQILVKAHSNVVLRSPNEGKGYFLELLLGKILAKVQKRVGESPSFRMGTPSAVITVRGTRFLVEVNRKRKTFVDVYEGVVEVAGIAENSPHILVGPGFSSGVDIDRAPEPPRQMNPGEGMDRDSSRDGQRNERNQEEQHNQPQQRKPESEGKPD